VSYKRTDLAIEACNYLKRHLRVIGTGPEYKSLKRLAGPNIEFLGSVSEHEKHEMLSRCRALLFPGVEDFGIVPVEAQAHGRPVIAFGAGGVLETVRGLGSDLQRKDESTGIFFFEQSVPALVDAIERFEANAHVFNKKMIREHVLQFDVAVFRERMSAFLEQKVLETRAGIDEGTYPSY
jgi:glycosyltransferase involved in cell wall biosynthesis